MESTTLAKIKDNILNQENLLKHLESLSKTEIHQYYFGVSRLGGQWFGAERVPHYQDLILYELNRRENRQSFIQMRNLTLVAVGLAIVQILMGIAAHRN